MVHDDQTNVDALIKLCNNNQTQDSSDNEEDNEESKENDGNKTQVQGSGAPWVTLSPIANSKNKQ